MINILNIFSPDWFSYRDGSNELNKNFLKFFIDQSPGYDILLKNNSNFDIKQKSFDSRRYITKLYKLDDQLSFINKINALEEISILKTLNSKNIEMSFFFQRFFLFYILECFKVLITLYFLFFFHTKGVFFTFRFFLRESYSIKGSDQIIDIQNLPVKLFNRLFPANAFISEDTTLTCFGVFFSFILSFIVVGNFLMRLKKIPLFFYTLLTLIDGIFISILIYVCKNTGSFNENNMICKLACNIAENSCKFFSDKQFFNLFYILCLLKIVITFSCTSVLYKSFGRLIRIVLFCILFFSFNYETTKFILKNSDITMIRIVSNFVFIFTDIIVQLYQLLDIVTKFRNLSVVSSFLSQSSMLTSSINFLLDLMCEFHVIAFLILFLIRTRINLYFGADFEVLCYMLFNYFIFNLNSSYGIWFKKLITLKKLENQYDAIPAYIPFLNFEFDKCNISFIIFLLLSAVYKFSDTLFLIEFINLLKFLSLVSTPLNKIFSSSVIRTLDEDNRVIFYKNNYDKNILIVKRLFNCYFQEVVVTILFVRICNFIFIMLKGSSKYIYTFKRPNILSYDFFFTFLISFIDETVVKIKDKNQLFFDSYSITLVLIYTILKLLDLKKFTLPQMKKMFT